MPSLGTCTTFPNMADLQKGKAEMADLGLYEGQLRRARLAARTLSTLHGFSRFLAFCNLTWATVVLLGGFVSDLGISDYSFVASLLLLEFVRLTSFTVSTHLITSTRVKQLIRSSLSIQHSEDHVNSRFSFLRLFLVTLQALLIISTLVLPSIRLRVLDYNHTPHLQKSLRIFYILVIINSVVSFVTVCCSIIAIILLYHPPEQSIIWYYEEILCSGLSSQGIEVLQPDNFEFFRFAYKMLGKYYEDWQLFAVAKLNKELIRYLYAHRSGMDFLRIYLDADDAYVQHAAVSLVGFWAADTDLVRVMMPVEVLTKLADKLGTGQVGWGAANAFGGLAKRDPALVTETMTSSGKPVVQRLAELVDASSARSLVLLRTLVCLFDKVWCGQVPQASDIVRMLSDQGLEDLSSKLKKLLANSRLHRVRIQSAYLLHLLGKLDLSCIPLIRNINPSSDFYWFTSEISMLQFFMHHITGDSDIHSVRIFERQDETSIHPPPWPWSSPQEIP